MTADLVHNGPQYGINPACHVLQARANYNEGIPSPTLASEGNKGGVRNPGAEPRLSSGTMNYKEGVCSQDERDNRTGSTGSRSPALLSMRKDSQEEDAEKSAHSQALLKAGDFSKLENQTLPGKVRKPQLQEPSRMDEAGGDADDEMEVTNKEEKKLCMQFGVQATVAAPQLQFQGNQAQYIQPGMTVGGWENFLPQRNLRILLVEDDDSTRHVVGALLRNCGYEVTPAASGAQAWELLQDKISHFDLVLTDVMLPSLSGISLLSKIMSQESCKQIPVVMMSSLDSVEIVFKCLSKGAVDFLVKPVRKNELKNLWQHVWRKCHSSSGSGSGSGSQTGKVAGLKNMNETANNSGSNDHDSSSWNAGGGSDNGSGTQSIWTKRVEVESPQQPTEKVVPCSSPDHTNTEFHLNANGLPKDRFKGKDLEVAASRSGTFEYHASDNANPKDSSKRTQRVVSPEGAEQNAQVDDERMTDLGAAVLESAAGVIDLLGNIACQHTTKDKKNCRGGDENSGRGASDSPTTKVNASGSSPLILELSLKRSHAADVEEGKVEDRHVLRQSGPSAFSRYSNGGSSSQQNPLYLVGAFPLSGFPPQGGFVGSSTPLANIGASSIGGLCMATPAERESPFKGSGDVSVSLPLYSHPMYVGNNRDSSPTIAGATGQEVHRAAREEGVSGAGVPKSEAFEGLGAFGTKSRHPVLHTSKPPWVASNPEQDGFAHQQFEDLDLPLQTHQQAYHHYSHHYHHHHVQHHYHHHLVHPNSRSLEAPEDDQTVTNPGTGAPQCGSSNIIGTVPGNLVQSGSSNGYGMNGNGSVNGSASGSNNGSNNHKGNSTNGQSGIMLTTAGGGNGDSRTNNMNSGNGNKSGNGISSLKGGNGSGLVAGPEHNNCFTRREAALNKFRQKRKERCFEKKVRYQSRKRLAEQRPRVRGQFVRQAAGE